MCMFVHWKIIARLVSRNSYSHSHSQFSIFILTVIGAHAKPTPNDPTEIESVIVGEREKDSNNNKNETTTATSAAVQSTLTQHFNTHNTHNTQQQQYRQAREKSNRKNDENEIYFVSHELSLVIPYADTSKGAHIYSLSSGQVSIWVCSLFSIHSRFNVYLLCSCITFSWFSKYIYLYRFGEVHKRDIYLRLKRDLMSVWPMLENNLSNSLKE